MIVIEYMENGALDAFLRVSTKTLCFVPKSLYFQSEIDF